MAKMNKNKAQVGYRHGMYNAGVPAQTPAWTNQPVTKTHEGGKASKAPNAEFMLRRSLLATLLWEDSFYESGESISERIRKNVCRVDPKRVADIALEARSKYKLRHAPLLVVREMLRSPQHKPLVADALEKVIQRPDELAEFLAIYWKEDKPLPAYSAGGYDPYGYVPREKKTRKAKETVIKRSPLAAQVKKGLARAFKNFDEYALAKYKGDNKGISLRDVMFLVHAKPEAEGRAKKAGPVNKEGYHRGATLRHSKGQGLLWQKLVNGELSVPDTWEVNLSAGEDKKETFTRLLSENKLGALALLRNLRNMREAGVDEKLIKEGLERMKVDRVLPYRFIAAARYAPNLEPQLEKAMFKCLDTDEKLSGKTVLLVDVSGSMDAPVSQKSDLNRIDAACGLAMLMREICEDVDIYTFSNEVKNVPTRRGFALKDAIHGSQPHGGTYLGQAINKIHAKGGYDRIVIITDEQSHDAVPNPKGKGYILNVASYQNGVNYDAYTHIDGWSEQSVRYIMELEKLNQD